MKIHLHAFGGLLKGTTTVPDNWRLNEPYWVPVRPPYPTFGPPVDEKRAIMPRTPGRMAFKFNGRYAKPRAWRLVDAEPIFEMELPWPM